MSSTDQPSDLIRSFKFERCLNQDQAGRRIALLGTIASQQALVTIERAPFSTVDAHLASLTTTLDAVKCLGANDIYYWFLANSQPAAPSEGQPVLHNIKVNLIVPCTEQHIRKYSKQRVRAVVETPQIYRDHVRPFMQSKRDQGKLNWVYNIIDGKKEVKDVIYRTPLGDNVEEGFLLLPDLNWDRKTMETLHLLCVVERRDIWSLRDLRKTHIDWLRRMRSLILAAILDRYSEAIESDELKCYVHYQPTYYHFHIHIVHVALEAGATQAVGKAIGLESMIETLELLDGSQHQGMDCITLHYTVGEQSELWQDVFKGIRNVA